MKKLTLVVTQNDNSFGGYIKEIPGCFGSGSTREELQEDIRASIDIYAETLNEPINTSGIEFNAVYK